MAFMGPKYTNTRKSSSKLVGRPPEIPEMGHGEHAKLGHPSASHINGKIVKPNK